VRQRDGASVIAGVPGRRHGRAWTLMGPFGNSRRRFSRPIVFGIATAISAPRYWLRGYKALKTAHDRSLRHLCAVSHCFQLNAYGRFQPHFAERVRRLA